LFLLFELHTVFLFLYLTVTLILSNPLATAYKFRSEGLGAGRDQSGFCIIDSEPRKLESKIPIDVPIIIKSKFNNEFLFILCKSDFGGKCCLAASPPSTLLFDNSILGLSRNWPSQLGMSKKSVPAGIRG